MTTIREYLERKYPEELNYLNEDGAPLTWEQAEKFVDEKNVEGIFTTLGCNDTAFRDKIFDGFAEYKGMTWNEFAVWMNSKETGWEFNTRETNITDELWHAVCNDDIEAVRKYYESGGEKNRRTYRFNREHSLIMGAYRNKNWDMVKFLIDNGETVTDEEKEELLEPLRQLELVRMLGLSTEWGNGHEG